MRCWACGAAAEPDPSWLPVALHRCPGCGLLFAPGRRPEDLRALYDAGYFEEYPGGEDYEDDRRQRRHEADIRIDLVRRFSTGGRLLEIGAAAGDFVAAALEAGFAPMGVEPAADLARRATERTGVEVLTGFVEDVELARETFDVVCAWHVVEHLSEPRAALSRLLNTLRPGGHLLVEVPNIQSIQARRLREHWANFDIAHHVGHYTPAALRELLRHAGFEIVLEETFPMRRYLRPGRALRPVELAAAAKEVAVLRANPLGSHPVKHEMLRAVGRRPARATAP